MRSEEEIRKMRKALKARIIPNLPLKPEWIRRDVEKEIDDFEFEHYFKQMNMEWIQKIVDRIRELDEEWKRQKKLGHTDVCVDLVLMQQELEKLLEDG